MQIEGNTNYTSVQPVTVSAPAPAQTESTNFAPVESADAKSEASNHNYDVNTSKTKDMSVDEKAQLSETEKNQLPVSERFMLEVVKKANKELSKSGRELEMSVHAKTKQVIVKVKDKENGEVIREIPSEKLLDMYASMLERAGLLVDEKR